MAENRIPSLDGARAISIGLVIAAHLNLAGHVPGAWRLDMGNLGVRVFFVISGFIITALLLSEQRRAGSISLKNFYRRRIFRIFPAYYTFLGTVLLLSALRGGEASWQKVWPATIFLADYVNLPLVTGHLWSLAVEEQFYLLWPGAMILLGLRKSYVGCIAILFLAPLFRLLADAGHWPSNPRYAFECVADALALGCLLAIFRDRLWANSLYRSLVHSPMILLPLVAALVLIGALENRGALYYTVGLSMLNLGIAVALDRYMRMPKSIVGGFLNLAPMVWLGLVSYSLYLWQQLFAWSPVATPVKIALMFGCAMLSYYAIERPFQRLRRWLEVGEVVEPAEPVKQSGTV